MSLWWATKEQLDADQVRLIEDLDLEGSYLVLGPPGSGKTNVLLRRAQFVRTQGMPNVQVLTFTRPLTEFLKTGCRHANGTEIFPSSLINTMESWIRGIFQRANVDLPDCDDFDERKRLMAAEAINLLPQLERPRLDVIFVDEAQDLFEEEVALLSLAAHRLFFVGDSRQRIYDNSQGLETIRTLQEPVTEHTLHFHYRLAPEICAMADRIMSTGTGQTLAATCHYNGPRPARVGIQRDRRDEQISAMIEVLKSQVRVYGDQIREGDRIGIIVPRKTDCEIVAEALNEKPELEDKWQVVRSRSGDSSDRNYVPTLDAERPILIMTEPACKGLEFRTVHWLFVNEVAHYRTDERYYTIVTRAKTSLDIYHYGNLPDQIARSHASPTASLW